VQAHCDRIGLGAEVESDPEDPGVLHINPRLERRPPVSIVIPTAGQIRDVRFEPKVLVVNCVRSIVERSTYEDFEIVCVVNDSVLPIVLQELRDIAGDRLKLVPYEGPFNFSAKVNQGVLRSEGEHVLILNDDIEVATPSWLDRMVMYSAQDGVGAVGAKLLWGDGRLQHVGVGFDDGLPGHTYYGFGNEYKGYANAVVIARNCMAVTGACLMTRREVFDEIGGMTTTLPINFNDMDYCLKVHAGGRRTVYDPDTVLYHFESSTRDPEVKEGEIEHLLGRWSGAVAQDPYGNPNLRRGLPRLQAHLLWAQRRRPRLRPRSRRVGAP
jgi:GT2 family glycosyltransferase